MPRNGKLFRIILALTAVGAIAAVVAAGAVAASKKQSAGSLTGAGSLLVAPAVSGVWGPNYSSSHGVSVNYSSIGSGKGILAITNRSVDFGASDAPMTDDQAAA